MTKLPDALAAFSRRMEAHLLLEPSARCVGCEARVAEDGSCVVVVVDLSSGGHISAGFDLVPGELFGAADCAFVEVAIYLMAAFDCEFRVPGGTLSESCAT